MSDSGRVDIEFTANWSFKPEVGSIEREVAAAKAQSQDTQQLMVLRHALAGSWDYYYRDHPSLGRYWLEDVLVPSVAQAFPLGQEGGASEARRYRQDFYEGKGKNKKDKAPPLILILHLKGKEDCGLRLTHPQTAEYFCKNQSGRKLQAQNETPNLWLYLPTGTVKEIGVGIVSDQDLLEHWPPGSKDVRRDYRILKSPLVLPLAPLYNAP